MLIYVCSCCYHPEVLSGREYAENSESIKFVASHRKDDNPGYFIVEAGDNPPTFLNKHKVKKLEHDFLLKMGYEWEETKFAWEDPQTKEIFGPLGWWHDPKYRKAKLEIVPEPKK